MKKEILYHLGITPEGYLQLFQAHKKKKDKSPRVLLQKLTDLWDRWIRSAVMSREKIIDTILLQQFLRDLEENTQR